MVTGLASRSKTATEYSASRVHAGNGLLVERSGHAEKAESPETLLQLAHAVEGAVGFGADEVVNGNGDAVGSLGCLGNWSGGPFSRRRSCGGGRSLSGLASRK